MEGPTIETFGLSLKEEFLLEREIAVFSESIAQNPYDFSAYITFGKALHEKKNFEKAEKAYRVAIDQINYLEKSYNSIRRTSMQKSNKGENSPAVANISDELNPMNAEAHYRLALALNAQGKQNEAISTLYAVVSLNPKFAEAYYQLCAILFESGNLDKALKTYELIETPPTDYILPYYHLGVVLGRQDKIKETLKVSMEEIDSNPVNAQAYITNFLGLCYQGKFGNAVQVYKTFEFTREMNGESSSEYSRFKDILDEEKRLEDMGSDGVDRKHLNAYYYVAVSLENSGKLGSAAKAYKTVLEIDPKHEEAFNKFRVLSQKNEETSKPSPSPKQVSQPQSDEDIARMSQAIVTNRKAMTQDYEEAEVYSASHEMKQSTLPHKVKAVCDVELAKVNGMPSNNNNTATGPNKANSTPKRNLQEIEAFYQQGQTLEGEFKFPEAIEAYTKMLELDPSYANAYVRIGYIHYNQQNLEDALIAFITAIGLEPKVAQSYNHLGMVLHDQKNYSEAISAFETAAKLDPRSAKAYSGLGLTFYSMKKYNEAVEQYDKAISLDPTCIMSYCCRGRICSHLGMEEKAVEDFNRAYELMQGNGADMSVSMMKNETFINEAIIQEREKLLKKLASLRRDAAETGNMLQSMQVKHQADQAGVAEYNKMKENISLMTDKVVASMEKQQKDARSLSKEEINELKREMAELKEMNLKLQKMLMQQAEIVNHVQKVIKVAGVEDKAIVKEKFAKLAVEDPDLFKYCKTFYWTLVSYFGAYRSLATNMVNANIYVDESTMMKAVEKGSVKVLNAAETIARGIPVVGSALAVLDKIVNYSIDTGLQHKLNHKVEVINKIIMLGHDPNMVLEEDLSLVCAKTALAVSEQVDLKQLEIVAKIPPTFFENVANKYNKVKNAVLPTVSLKDCVPVDAALEDVTMLLSYIFLTYEDILNSKKPLDVQFAALMKEARTNKEGLKPEKPEKPEKKEKEKGKEKEKVEKGKGKEKYEIKEPGKNGKDECKKECNIF